MLKVSQFLVLLLSLICFLSCSTRVVVHLPSVKKPYHKEEGKNYKKTEFVRYSIQVGAFRSFTNADAFSRKLNKYVDAFSYKDNDGFFKVRFGNYSSKSNAVKKAEQLKSQNIIEEYFVVLPNKYENQYTKTSQIRQQIVSKADKYIGVPYRWGGENSSTGFDCSGLTSSVYRESGIMLPRTSNEQFGSGTFVLKKDLQRGDLVFFKTQGKRVSHVGIYTGNFRFVHAPGRGKTVCYQSLNSDYYKEHYAGARTYF